jgi:hypothetical protein
MARTDAQVARLKREGVQTKDFWFLVHGKTVTLTAQRRGEPATAQIQIPKRVFNRFVSMYLEG